MNSPFVFIDGEISRKYGGMIEDTFSIHSRDRKQTKRQSLRTGKKAAKFQPSDRQKLEAVLVVVLVSRNVFKDQVASRYYQQRHNRGQKNAPGNRGRHGN